LEGEDGYVDYSKSLETFSGQIEGLMSLLDHSPKDKIVNSNKNVLEPPLGMLRL